MAYREPLFTQERTQDFYGLEWNDAVDHVVDFYEDLITSGKLKVVEEVENTDDSGYGFTCSKCKIRLVDDVTYRDGKYVYEITHCPGCGNPIKAE